jgi:hypothetical protein
VAVGDDKSLDRARICRHNLDEYWPVGIGSVCGETDDAVEVEAEWEASGVSEAMRGMFGSMDWE